MGYLGGIEAQREDEELARKHRRLLDEISAAHWGRARDAGSFYPWFILIVILLLLASFIYVAYGTYRGMQNLRPAVAPPAAPPAQGQPPQDTKPKQRAKTQASPAPERK